MWRYRARVIDVVDGDTLDALVDVGFHITRQVRLRLKGVDTAEIYGVEHTSEEYQHGRAQMQFVSEWLTEAELGGTTWPVIVRTEKTGKYGRYIATVERQRDGAVLNEALRDEFDGVARDD